jgi:hypothetical protein
VQLKIVHLIGQEKRLRDEFVFLGEKPLDAGRDYTKDVFLGKMLHQLEVANLRPSAGTYSPSTPLT